MVKGLCYNNGIDLDDKVDIGAFAVKILSSMAAIMVNSILTVTLGTMKLTGFTIITSIALGYLTKPIHIANKALAQYAFTPLKKWSEILDNENERIIEIDKVVSIEKKIIYFNTKNYKKCTLDSFKTFVATISLSLSVTNATLWLAVKPLWLAMFLPGMAGDFFLAAPIALNKGIGCLTYAPLRTISDWMWDKHSDYLISIAPY